MSTIAAWHSMVAPQTQRLLINGYSLENFVAQSRQKSEATSPIPWLRHRSSTRAGEWLVVTPVIASANAGTHAGTHTHRFRNGRGIVGVGLVLRFKTIAETVAIRVRKVGVGVEDVRLISVGETVVVGIWWWE